MPGNYVTLSARVIAHLRCPVITHGGIAIFTLAFEDLGIERSLCPGHEIAAGIESQRMNSDHTIYSVGSQTDVRMTFIGHIDDLAVVECRPIECVAGHGIKELIVVVVGHMGPKVSSLALRIGRMRFRNERFICRCAA